MQQYIVLLRSVNVGGKNKLPMAALRTQLEAMGFQAVRTYIQSGNVLLQSDRPPVTIGPLIEAMVSKEFVLDSSLIKVLVLSAGQLQTIVANKPAGFGDQPSVYHSDVIFLMGLPLDQARAVFSPRDGVDRIWPGDHVVYSQRLSADRTKSRLGQIIGTPAYKSMTIRNWNTTMRLLELSQASTD